MQKSVWKRFVQTGDDPYLGSRTFGIEPDPDAIEGPPGWTFDRFGSTRTLLPDGRVVCVAGEHEDTGWPDFFIYNDVIVICPATGDIEIFGYGIDVFPPTDFHTASLVDGAIYLIGGLGYRESRSGSVTPVYRLDLESYRITRLEVDPVGCPGRIFNHLAEVTKDGRGIRIFGGTILSDTPGGGELSRQNSQTFVLDLDRRSWSIGSGTVPTLPPPPMLDRTAFKLMESADEARIAQEWIRRAASPTHPLFATDCWWPIARLTESPESVLLRALDHSGRFAICKGPSVTGRQPDDELPVILFDDLAALERHLAASSDNL